MIVTRWPRKVDPGWLQTVMSHRGLVDVAIHIEPVPEDEAADDLEHQLIRYASTVELGRADLGIGVSLSDTEKVGKEVVRGDTRLHQVGLYFTVHGESLEQLEEETTQLRRRLRKVQLRVEPAMFRQRRGLLTTLPLGCDLIGMRRRLTSEVVGDSLPFATGGFTGHPDTGVLYGENLVNGCAVMVDRWRYEAPHMAVLGKSGSGKSFFTKKEIGCWTVLGVPVRILDPEGEYEALTRTLGGTIVTEGFDRPYEGLVCYSLRQMTERERVATCAVVLETLWEQARLEVRRQVIVVDEAFLGLVANADAAHLLWRIVKGGRRFGLALTVATQDLSDVTSTELGESILNNGGVVVLLRQSTKAIDAVGKAFDLSKGQRDFLVSAPQGHALMLAGDEQVSVKVVANPFEAEYCRTDLREPAALLA